MKSEREQSLDLSRVSDYSLSFMRWGSEMVRDQALFKALGGIVLIGVGMVTDRAITGLGIYFTLKHTKEFYDDSKYTDAVRREELERGII